jgi:hypothetical protein
VVTGIDASQPLVSIARARTPDVDFWIGDVFALPFPDACFDVAASFNGIWEGCEEVFIRQAASTPARPTRTGSRATPGK